MGQEEKESQSNGGGKRTNKQRRICEGIRNTGSNASTYIYYCKTQTYLRYEISVYLLVYTGTLKDVTEQEETARTKKKRKKKRVLCVH